MSVWNGMPPSRVNQLSEWIEHSKLVKQPMLDPWWRKSYPVVDIQTTIGRAAKAAKDEIDHAYTIAMVDLSHAHLKALRKIDDIYFEATGIRIKRDESGSKISSEPVYLHCLRCHLPMFKYIGRSRVADLRNAKVSSDDWEGVEKNSPLRCPHCYATIVPRISSIQPIDKREARENYRKLTEEMMRRMPKGFMRGRP